MNKLKPLLFLIALLGYNMLFAQCPGTPPLAFTFESTESRCESNGTITLHITGGMPFTDTNGNPIYNNTIIAPIVIPIGGQADSVFAALAADTYTVEVQDANGCSVTHQVTVPGTHMQLELEIDFADAICDGSSGGWICGTADEGRPWPVDVYEYQLFDATTTPPTPITARQTDSCFTNLAAGTYQIRAFDSCQNFQTRDVILGVKQYSANFGIWQGLIWKPCTEQCMFFFAREKTGGLLPEYPVNWIVSSSTDPNILGTSGTIFSNTDKDTVCWSPMYQTGEFVLTFTDACGAVETLKRNMTAYGVFGSTGYSCTDGNTMFFNKSSYCAEGTMTFETYQVPPGAPAIPPQDTGYFTNLQAGTYCWQVSDCCGNTASFCRNILGPIWTMTIRNSFEFACDSGAVSFEVQYNAPNNSPQPTGNEDYILTSAPMGYATPNMLPDTFEYRDVVTGPPGTYCFTLEDECLRTFDSCFVLNNPLTFDYVPIVTEACVTGNSVEINFNQTGGANLILEADFYQIAPVMATIQEDMQNLNWYNLTAGTYVVELENNRSDNCVIKTDTFVIPEYIFPSIEGAWGIECDNGAGLITVDGSGGNLPYTYELFQGPVTRPLQTSPSFPGLPIGTYDIRMFDNCGNSEIATVSIEPFMPVIQGYGGAFCIGDTAFLYVDYFDLATYSWSGPNGATSDTSVLIIPNISAADAGTYTVNIDVANPDQTACVAQTLTITTSVFNCNCEIDTIVGTALSCFAGMDGTASVTTTNGVPPYTFDWSNGDNTQNISNLAAGTYTVTITDSNSCSATGEITLAEPDSLAVSLSATNVSCNAGSDGSITATPSGGTQTTNTCTGVTYLWSNGATTATNDNLPSGTYMVTVTDCNGCVATNEVAITEPSQIAISETITDVSCAGVGDGSIVLVVTGGTIGIPNCSDYTYIWTSGATTATATGLGEGTHEVTVTDCNGCSVLNTFIINGPSLLTCAATSSDVTCSGAGDGNATVAADGGTAPYSYLWDNGATTTMISGLIPGTYFVTVTDNSGCSTTCSVELSEPDLLVFTSEVTDVTCFKDADGAIDITVNGGTSVCSAMATDLFISEYIEGSGSNKCVEIFNGTGAPVNLGTYTLAVYSNGNTSPTGTYNLPATMLADNDVFVVCNPNAGTVFTGIADATSGVLGYNGNDAVVLATGVAAIDVFGNIGCDLGPWTAGTTSTQNQTLVRNATVTVGVPVDDPTSCPFPTLGTEWTSLPQDDASNLGSHTFGGAGLSYVWSNGAVTEDLTGLAGGTYTLTVTDCNGCVATGNVVVAEPADIAITDSIGQVSCNGGADGSIDISVTGGVPTADGCLDYTYLWSDGAITQNISGLIAGSYTVTVTDCNGCIATNLYTITEPDLLTCTATASVVNCGAVTDGSATAAATGGTMPYTYTWDTGATTATITGLVSGVYAVTTTDDAGCTSTCSVMVDQPSEFSVSLTATDLICNQSMDGTVTATPIGGTQIGTICMGVSYVWSTGATTASISGLMAGSYSVTATDCNGCTATEMITILEPSALTIADSVTQVSCNGDADGSIDISVTGGTVTAMNCSDYEYMWSDGSTTEDITGLAAGSYTVTVVDCNGCTATNLYTITEPDLLSCTTFPSHVTCNGASDGAAGVTAMGGTSPYTYLWSNGATTTLIVGLSSGTFAVTVTDDAGCTTTCDITITEPDLFSLDVTGTAISCNGSSDGTITATASGGTQVGTTCTGVSYIWNTGATTPSITGLVGGTYSVAATDCNGCVATGSFTIVEPDELTCSVLGTDVGCHGGGDGTAVVTPTGGTSPYTYSWNNGSSSDSLFNLVAGVYTVTVTDSNACSTTCSVTIAEPGKLSSSVSVMNVSCSSTSDGEATVVGTGGTPGYTYQWDSGQSGTTATGLAAGTYSVSVTDANGCCYVSSVVIGQTMCDPCELVANGVLDICAELAADPNHPLASLDCDNGGVINIIECNQNTDPVEPSDDCDAADAGSVDICAILIDAIDHPLASLDCDNGGVINIIECQNGADPFESSDDCQAVKDGNLDLCVIIGLDPNHPLSTQDCDDGGVDNYTECRNSGDPCDPNDDCRSAVLGDIDICAILDPGGTGTFDPTHPWASLDCDEGGIINITECINGDDPGMPSDDILCPTDDCNEALLGNIDICVVLTNDPTDPIGSLDCDEDGVINSTECTDMTDPIDPCDFEEGSITEPVTADQSGCLNLCPDLTPVTTILPGNIAGISVVGIAVEVNELNGIDTDGTPITVRVPSDPRLTFVWDPALMFVALTPVNNANWNYQGDNGVVHTFVFTGNAQVIAGGTTEAFGMETTYDPQSTDGQTTITATIIPFNGGECNVINNTDSERLVYFE